MIFLQKYPCTIFLLKSVLQSAKINWRETMHGKNANSLENKLCYISGYLEIKLLDFLPLFEVNCVTHYFHLIPMNSHNLSVFGEKTPNSPYPATHYICPYAVLYIQIDM